MLQCAMRIACIVDCNQTLILSGMATATGVIRQPCCGSASRAYISNVRKRTKPDNGRYPLSRAPGEPWLDPSEGWRVPWRLAADVQRFCDWTTGRTGSHAQAPTGRALLQPDYEPRALQSPGAGLRPTGH